jgi:hypothetical protein
MTHHLSAFEESFIEDGIVSVCECGWKSEKQITEGNAVIAYRKHATENQVVTCHACGCKVDDDGCGCNPVGA